MCLIVFAYRTVPGYELILAGNRDEFYERPTRSARFWPDNPAILAGRDEVAGGTWLGLHKNRRYAAVTNYRKMGTHKPEARSRGHLVREYLESSLSSHQYIETLDNPHDYNGFNLLAGDHRSLCYFSNINREPDNIGGPELLKPGIHGISNARLNTPWPKVVRARKRFRSLMEKDTLTDVTLFDLLADQKTWPDDQLPNTGLPPEMERAVSAIFIQTPDYGTRSSTLLYIKPDGSVRFVERVFRPGTTAVEEVNGYDFRFQLPPVKNR